MEGNDNSNLMGQAQDILHGLPDLNLLLGPIQAHQPLIHVQPSPEQIPAPPAQAPQFEFINLLPPAQQVSIEGIDLNVAIPTSPSQSAHVCSFEHHQELILPATEDLHQYTYEEDGSLFNIILAEGDDPVIQLATPVEYMLAIEKEKNDSTTVDEEFEIIDFCSDATSKPILDPASNDDIIISSSSDSSAPPGFDIKGKYLSHDNDSPADTVDQIQASWTAWRQHFAHEAEGRTAIQVPLDWVDFICATLLTPDKFDWAKMFLKSPMWQIITEEAQNKDYLNFFIPKSCPVNEAIHCSQAPNDGDSFCQRGSSDKEDATEEAVFCNNAANIKGKRKARTPVVESEVRRSERLQLLNKGYKKKPCQDGNCMACVAKPPICSIKIIKNLNSSYCKVDPKVCTKENLLEKKAKKGGKQPAWRD